MSVQIISLRLPLRPQFIHIFAVEVFFPMEVLRARTAGVDVEVSDLPGGQLLCCAWARACHPGAKRLGTGWLALEFRRSAFG